MNASAHAGLHCKYRYLSAKSRIDPDNAALQKDVYDKTGKVQLSVEEQLRQSFGHGELQTAHE